MTFAKIMPSVIVALLCAGIVGGWNMNASQARMEAKQDAMSARIERIEKRIDAATAPDQRTGYLDFE